MCASGRTIARLTGEAHDRVTRRSWGKSHVRASRDERAALESLAKVPLGVAAAAVGAPTEVSEMGPPASKASQPRHERCGCQQGAIASNRGTHSGTHSTPKSARNAGRERDRASCLKRRIGAYCTQGLFFRLLPKLDVAGSSPVARSVTHCRATTYDNGLPDAAGPFSWSQR